MQDIVIKPTEASLATDRLREEIVSGAVSPGQKLTLVPLARRYEVSRGPLREAASRLAAEGLVTIEDQRGFRVTPLSREDLLDVTATRERIEELAVRDALAHGDLDWEGRVLAAWHVLDRVTEHDGSAEGLALFAQQHEVFHAELVSACPSMYLLEFRARLYALFERYRNLAAERYLLGVEGRDVRQEHKELAEAAVARDVPATVERLMEHLRSTQETLIAAYPDLFAEGP